MECEETEDNVMRRKCSSPKCGAEGPGKFCQECGSKMEEMKKTGIVVMCDGQSEDGSVCGAELKPAMKFCSSCGSKVNPLLFADLTDTCSKCGFSLQQNVVFCEECGQRRNKPSKETSSLPSTAPEDVDLNLASESEKSGSGGNNSGTETSSLPSTAPEDVDLKIASESEKSGSGGDNSGTGNLITIIDDLVLNDSENDKQDLINNATDNKLPDGDNKIEAVSETILDNSTENRKQTEIHIENTGDGNLKIKDETNCGVSKTPAESINDVATNGIKRNCQQKERDGKKMKLGSDNNQQVSSGGIMDRDLPDTDQSNTTTALDKSTTTEDNLRLKVDEMSAGNNQMEYDSNSTDHPNQSEIDPTQNGDDEPAESSRTDRKPSTERGSKISEDSLSPENEGNLTRSSSQKVFGGGAPQPDASTSEPNEQTNQLDLFSLDKSPKSDGEISGTTDTEPPNSGTDVDKVQTRSMAKAKKDEENQQHLKVTGTGNKRTGNTRSDSIRVQFHLLTSDDLKFDINRHKCIIAFGNKEMGGWNRRDREMKVVKHIDGNYCELYHEENIRRYLIIGSNNLVYKYSVEDSKKGQVIWEYYYKEHRHGGIPNRELNVTVKHKNLETWHQFDGCFEVEPHWSDKFIDYFRGQSSPLIKRARASIDVFCPAIDGHGKDFDTINANVQYFRMMYDCYKKIYFNDFRCWTLQTEFNDFIADALVKAMIKKWTVETSLDSDSVSLRDKATASALTILCILRVLKISVSDTKSINVLSRALLVRVDDEKKDCPDFHLADSIFPDKRKYLLEAVVDFVKSIAKTSKNPCWLTLMPWIHFLSGSCVPYQEPDGDISHDNVRPVWWGLEQIFSDQEAFKRRSKKWLIPMEKMLKQLQPLFQMDFYLPRTFIASVEFDDLLPLIKSRVIPVEICLANLTYQVKVNKPHVWFQDDVKAWFVEAPSLNEKEIQKCLQSLLNQLQETFYSEHRSLIQWSMCYRIAYHLLKQALETRRSETIHPCVQIFIHCIAMYDRIQSALEEDKQTNEHNELLSTAFKETKNTMERYFNKWDLYLEKLLLIWNNIFAPVELQSVRIKDVWNQDASEALLNRLKTNVCRDSFLMKQFVLLYCKQLDEFNTSMQSCLSQAAFLAIEKGYGLDYGSFTGSERKRYGDLLSSLFISEWKKNIKDENEMTMLRHSLRWPPFSQYLKIFYKGTGKMEMLSGECSECLVKAVSVVESRVTSLLTGAITIGDLRMISDAQEKFPEIAELVQKHSAVFIKKAFTVRQIELRTFENQAREMANLAALCQYLPQVDLRPIDETLNKQSEIETHQIKEFCKPADVGKIESLENFHPDICAFKVSNAVSEMVPELYKLLNSSTFMSLWTKVCKSIEAQTLDEVVENVWSPVKKHLEELKQKIINGTLMFHEFEQIIGRMYREDEAAMVNEMSILGIPSSVSSERVDQLKKYRHLAACARGAKVIMEFAHHYKLKGDFRPIRAIASHGDNRMEMRSFNESVMKACTLLEDLTKEKADCLKTYTQCGNLIAWLKESMKEGGLKELKVFVDLAYLSAGDEPMNIARVQCLHTAVTGYAPLIFDLTPDCGYEGLLNYCAVVWKELENNPRLPKMLEDTNHQLEWMKEIKKAHGSVEVTSLMQAEAINANGVYTVGRNAWKRRQQTHQDTPSLMVLADVLELSVKETAGKTLKNEPCFRSYTFSQLQDLQSRLMLVAGKAEKGSDSVDRFTMIFDSLTRLSNVYLKLCSSGCVLFKDWTARFFCDPNPKRPVCVNLAFGMSEDAPQMRGRRSETVDLEDLVPEIARFMEKCLDEWLDYIKEKRKSYLHLNYFTVDQLVILQRELVKVGSDDGPSHLIYPLLSAVKQDCTPADLSEAISKAEEDIKQHLDMDNKMVNMETDMLPSEPGNEENSEEERKLDFVRKLVEADYHEKLAFEAAKHVEDYDVNQGIVWCIEHEDMFTSGDDAVEEEMDVNPVVQMPALTCMSESMTDIQSLIRQNISELQNDDVGVEPLIQSLNVLWRQFLESISSNIRDYLSLEHLGLILRYLSRRDTQTINRSLLPVFKEGQPNLVICPSADVLMTTLSVYVNNQDQPLPQSDEVLMCTPNTTKDEVDIFWRRAIYDDSRKIHCLVNADMLDYDVGEAAERCLEQYLQDVYHEEMAYRLLVICSSENENRSTIISSLDKYKRHLLPFNIDMLRQYLLRNLQVLQSTQSKVKSAAYVDNERSTVRVVKSWRAGVGKSLFKIRREDTLSSLNRAVRSGTVSIPLQEKNLDIHYVIERLLEHTTRPDEVATRLFHIDVSHEVQNGIDYLLFNLLILGCLMDKTGWVWRKSPMDYYLIETMPLMMQAANRQGDLLYVHTMLRILPDVTCRSPVESANIYQNGQNPNTTDQLFDAKLFRSPTFQRPYQYLVRLDQGRQLEDVHPQVPEGDPQSCLLNLLRHCGLEDPSWSELHHFVWFLNTQLVDFEQNNFVGPAAADLLPGFAKFVLRFLLQMSKDFSTRSLNMSEESPHVGSDVQESASLVERMETDDNDKGDEDDETVLQAYQMRRTWESSPHPYLFFNSDRFTFTFLGFNIDKGSGNLIDQQTGTVLEQNIMRRKLYDGLINNHAPLQENFDNLPRQDKILKLCNVMGIDMPHDPDNTYELTTDNVKKMLAIYMRFRCDIPVIIMGETGCGKTCLIKFMCALQVPPGAEVQNMVLMKVHGGTTKSDIERKVREADALARENSDSDFKNMYTVLFFDEANTTESIGLIKEIMCDKSIAGKKLDLCDSLKIVAACNPYRKHSEELIKKLEQAGLGYHVDADETTDRLGRVPMRRLVYRVQPLPHSLLPLVWDFGQLNTQVEELYIRQMVRRYAHQGDLPSTPGLVEAVSAILAASQEFLRMCNDECSFVSLRDVERALTVMSWFYKQSHDERTLFGLMDQMLDKVDESSEEEEEDSSDDELSFTLASEDARVDDVTRSLILALGVCYHACLKSRELYRCFISKSFTAPVSLPGGEDQILTEIECCQDVFLESVTLDKNIARNMALKENIFMMVVCIELRIPLFLVGKPGSSKSLAKTIVSDAMQGRRSKCYLFKELKAAHMVSFQCSPLSTADGIVSTFKQCAQFQQDKDLDNYVAVVVLDEVGLAEDSPRMPLKALHPLLEDGCLGNETPKPHEKVAFIGISNWALDPAKMNRGILVQREVPDLEELVKSARGICEMDGNDRSVRSRILAKKMEILLEPLATAYLELFDTASNQMREFFGLRDFYSLMKMVCGFVLKSRRRPTWYEILHAVKRNFGGMEHVDSEACFRKHLQTVIPIYDKRRKGDPECTPDGLITACLFDTNNLASQSRYLLLLTENYGAISIMEQLIHTKSRDFRPVTIFGSSFRSDQEYTQVCRNINKIKVCMETGNTVVLLNLENLYESLYDALNQYYEYCRGERYVNLGLGTHQVKCSVHANFRLIVVAEKETVYKKFPIPLINRLEKHFLTISTLLNADQLKIVDQIKSWVEQFCSRENLPRTHSERNVRDGTSTLSGVFIGFNEDACSAIVLNVWDKHAGVPERNNQVFRDSKLVLLWCATPDSVVSLKFSQLPMEEQVFLQDSYFRDQAHGSLTEYLHQKIVADGRNTALFAQITTHSKLLASADRKEISSATNIPIDDILFLESLPSFDTEQQFSIRVRQYLHRAKRDDQHLIIIQCESGDINADLVACARYCVMDEIEKMRDELSACVHVVLIIQLPRHSVFTGFQCGIWQSAHIDDLRPEETGMPHVSQMLQMSPAQLVSGFVIKGDSEEETELSSGILISSIHAALGLVKEEEENTNRETERVTIVMELLQQNQTDGTSYFVHGLICLLARLLSEKESVSYSFQLAREWVVKEAATDESLSKTGTFRRSCIQTLQKKVIPIIAGIIAFLDTNDNLKLLLDNNTSWKSRLWKGLLSNHEALSLKYSDLQTHNNKSELPEVTVKTTGYENHRYSARVPFSWIIIEEIEEILAVLKQTNTYENDTGEEDGRSDQDVAIEILCRNFIGRFLNCHEFVDSVEEIVHEYVHDLIHTFYHTATQDELQLVSESILYRASKLVGPEKTLVNQLVCIHKAHIILSEEMQYFRDINRIWPECSAAIINAREEQPDHFMFCEKAYTFSGLCLMVESLAPASKELNDATGRAHWLNRVHRFRPTVENILCWHKKNPSLYGARSLQCVRKATFLWNRVLVMKLFLEHVCMSDQEDKISIKYIITLWKYLGEEADLKQMKTLKGLETFLKACNKQAETQYKGAEIECAHCGRKLDGVPVTLPCKDIICEQCLDLMSSMQNRCMKCNKQFDDNWSPLKNSSPRLAERMLKDYQKRCNTFFMDVVSQLCFADSEAPSQDVVEHLLGYIFLTSRDKQQKSCTRTMSVIETGIDPNPVFRSFLLQLLLKTSEDHVSGYIQSYLDLARQCVVDDDKDNIAQTLELNLLVIQCIENKLIQDCCKGESTSEASCAVQALRAASSGIQSDQQDVEKLYAIARTRMGLSIAAKYIAQIVKQQIDVKLADYGVRRVIDAAWKLYDESKLEWIRKYLVKYICRRYGTDIYSQACRSAAPSLRWLALTKEEEEKATEVPDRFIVCGRSYTNVREVVTQIVLGENVSHLTEVVEGHSGENVNTALMLGLAQYREITCSNLCPEHQRNVTPQVVKKIQEFIGSCDLKKHKELLDCIMLNQLTPHRLVVTEGEDEHLQGVQCLLVHFMLVMNTVDGRQTLLEALQTLIQNPGTCTEMLLPTMPQDDIVTVKEALLNSRQNASEENPVFYHCPNGHPYFIGDCGRPYVVDKCNECGADIGGRGHKLLHDNIKDDGVDRTVSGHILGPAETRGQGPDPMRMMRPLYCATVRLMLHLAMYLGAGAHPEDIGTVIKSNIADTDVEEFVWDHLQLDLEDMQRALGRSTDDVLLLMHIILHQISAAQHLGDRLSDEACYLTTKEGRETWETRLCSMFLEPVFKKLDELLKRHNLLLAEDERLGTNTMLCMLYETANDGSDNMSAHHQLQEMSRVWRYSTPITWQHLKQQLDAMFTSQNGAQQHQYRVLQIFVEEEPILKALRFVPSILKLHQILLHKYQRKIDRKEASQITVADIMRDLDGSEMDMLLKHFTEAWEIVRGHLKTRVCPTRAGGAVVPVAYSTQRITPATPISVLLPSIRDAGLCSYAMLDFLFRKHNQVLDRYCKETDRSASVMTVSPREVTAAHLISYDPEHDILPLILANCQYSFEMGKGTKIEYDFTGLERQLMDRFLFSKSRIEVGNFLQVDEMVYRTELTDAEIFQKLEEKIPQESLDPTVKVHIYDELRTLPDICGALDNIDIVISFLKSTGGQPEENLHNFMVNVLKMNQGCNLSLTVRRHCELRHCKALWLYLSLLKARQMMNQKQSSEAVFETVPPQLHEELPEDLVLELKEYMTTLSTEHLSRLVEDLFEFIVLKVAVRDNRNDADLGETIDFKLGEFLSEYITLMDRPEVLVRILETFPADITYRYCVHSWINAHAALNDRKPVINNLGS